MTDKIARHGREIATLAEQMAAQSIEPTAFFDQSMSLLREIETLLIENERSEVVRLRQVISQMQQLTQPLHATSPKQDEAPATADQHNPTQDEPLDDATHATPTLHLATEPQPTPAPPSTPVTLNTAIERPTPPQPTLPSQSSTPHTDKELQDLLSINDRFLFARELFDNDFSLMERELSHLSTLTTQTAANAYITSRYNWDNEAESTLLFQSLLERHYQS